MEIKNGFWVCSDELEWGDETCQSHERPKKERRLTGTEWRWGSQWKLFTLILYVAKGTTIGGTRLSFSRNNSHHDHSAKNQSKTASLYSSIPTDVSGKEVEDEMVCFTCTVILPHAHIFQRLEVRGPQT